MGNIFIFWNLFVISRKMEKYIDLNRKTYPLYIYSNEKHFIN